MIRSISRAFAYIPDPPIKFVNGKFKVVEEKGLGVIMNYLSTTCIVGGVSTLIRLRRAFSELTWIPISIYTAGFLFLAAMGRTYSWISLSVVKRLNLMESGTEIQLITNSIFGISLQLTFDFSFIEDMENTERALFYHRKLECYLLRLDGMDYFITPFSIISHLGVLRSILKGIPIETPKQITNEDN